MKKQIACILAFLLFFPFLLPSFVRGAEEETADMAFLRSIGIVGEKFNPSTIYVTRAEAAMILSRCAAAIPVKSESDFTDVDDATQYGAEINAAHRLGLIAGYGDGTFQPQRSVTAVQMVKMLVSLAGYTQNAEALGGYPAGYLAVAVQKGILKSSLQGDTPLSYDEMARLVRNTLEAPLRQGEIYEDGNVEFAETDENILSAWHGIKTVTGLVTGNYLSVLFADRTIGKGEVAIDGKVYKAGTSAAPSLMCRKVKAYIDEDAETVLYAELHSSGTEIIVDADDIVSASKNKLVYEQNGKEKSCVLSGAALIKNGVVVSPWDDADLAIENGRLRLISGQGGSVDYVLAECFVNRIVDAVNTADKTVRFKDGTVLTVDTDTPAVKTVFEETNGRPASLAYTYPMDVFSVMESEGILKIIRSAKLILGKVEELSTDSVTIGGKTFSIDPVFAKSEDFRRVTVGMEADFYLDYTGKLAAIDTTRSGIGTYGLLVSGYKKGGLSPTAQLKIFSPKGTWLGPEAAPVVNVNGVATDEGDLFSGNSPLMSDGKVQRQLIQYDLNADGEICKIQTAADFTDDPDNEERLSVFSKDGYIDENRRMNGETMTFRDDNMQIFNNRFRVKNGVTKIFKIPKTEGTDDEYSIAESDTLLGGSLAGTNINMTFYEVSETYLVSVIVWEIDGGGRSEPNHEMDYMAVSRVYTAADKDGMPEQKIEGYLINGNTKVLTVEDGFESYFRMVYSDMQADDPSLYDAATGHPKNKIPASAIRAGDVIQFQATAAGTATLLNVVARGCALSQGELYYNGYTSGQSAIYTPTKFGSNGTYCIACSTAQRADRDSVVTKILKPGQAPLLRVYPTCKCVLLYDKGKDTVTKIGTQDIMPDDMVLTVHSTQEMKCIIACR